MFEKIGIVCAVPQEAQPFIDALKECTVTEKAVISVFDGTLCGKNVAVVRCGVGRVNAAAATQLLIDSFCVNAVIMAGSAGAIDPSLNIADIAVISQCAYHDVQSGVLQSFYPFIPGEFFHSDERLLSAAQTTAGSFSSHSVRFGTAVSGDVFIVDEGRQSIIDRFSPLCVDMETAGAAQVCYLNSMPYLAVRSISDTPHESGISSFEQNLGAAAQSAFEFTSELIKNI